MTMQTIVRNIPNNSKRTIEKLSGLVLHFEPNMYKLDAVSKTVEKDVINMTNSIEKDILMKISDEIIARTENVEKENSASKKEENKIDKNSDIGFHYILDEKNIYELIPEKYIANPYRKDIKHTYISNILFNSVPQETTISLCVAFNETDDYEKIEKKLMSFCYEFLKKNKLETDNLWRSFDLSKELGGPFHMINLNIWKSFLNEINNKLKDEKYEMKSAFSNTSEKNIHEAIKNSIEKNYRNPEAFLAKYEPFDKGLEIIKDKKASFDESSFKTKSIIGSANNLKYQIIQKPPITSADTCVKAVDDLKGTYETEKTLCEPIYPDLIAPPGREIYIADGFSKAKAQSNNNVPLTNEELKKRQQTFNINDFSKMKKITVGKPINSHDPFPVDDVIQKLEDHFPKVKIDKIKYALTDDNHPGSELGSIALSNFTMIYDMFEEITKRVEKRLVKMENNVATITRNLYRTASRMNINCCYYGGQDVYGKYKCIRCLHDDRINDGASVTLDQCLNCTRYEPIIGQIYAILDENGQNIVQVMDDLQMSYMGVTEYSEFTRINEYHKENKMADLNKKPDTNPKSFEESKWKDIEEKKSQNEKKENNKKSQVNKKENNEKYKVEEEEKQEPKIISSFKMDWKPVPLEFQSTNINRYSNENIKAEKNFTTSNKEVIRKIDYTDSREKAIVSEKLEFDIENYKFEDFGHNDNIAGNNDGGAIARAQICEYAEKKCELGKQKKALYSQGQRMNHNEKAINGIEYFDCSSFVAACYEAAGLTMFLNNGYSDCTWDEFTKCTSKTGGFMETFSKIENAKPGDIIFYSYSPASKVEETVPSSIHHVSIYLGDGYTAQAIGDEWGVDKVTFDWDKNSGKICFGRPKELIELDNMASSDGFGIPEYWTRSYHNIGEDLWGKTNNVPGNVDLMIENMNKYNYKNSIIQAAKQFKFDPYLVAAIISVESGGDPNANAGGQYQGLLQADVNELGPTAGCSLSQIALNLKAGLQLVTKKKPHLLNNGWKESNEHVLISAFNSGEGTVVNASHNYNVNLSNCKIPQLGEALYKEVAANQPGWSPDEKREYATKVLRAYNIVVQKKCLGNVGCIANGGNVKMPPIDKRQIEYNIHPRKSKIEYLVIHDTGVIDSTAESTWNYFSTGSEGRAASAEYAVDSNKIIQCSDPDKYYTINCGGSANIRNDNTIGIEMSHTSGDNTKVYNNTIALIRYLMKKYKLSKDKVVRHFDASGKICPGHMHYDNWKKWHEFRAKI